MPLPFILCPECGECIGEVVDFIQLCQKYFYKNILEKENKKNINIDKINLNNEILPPIGFILDAVELYNICCRSHILGITD